MGVVAVFLFKLPYMVTKIVFESPVLHIWPRVGAQEMLTKYMNERMIHLGPSYNDTCAQT